jgi:hypothetical protein
VLYVGRSSGARLLQAIKEAGYINRRGNADLIRFALDHRWLPNYVYRWTKDQSIPEKANLDRLGRVLRVAPAWLLFGDDVAKYPSKRYSRANVPRGPVVKRRGPGRPRKAPPASQS